MQIEKRWIIRTLGGGLAMLLALSSRAKHNSPNTKRSSRSPLMEAHRQLRLYMTLAAVLLAAPVAAEVVISTSETHTISIGDTDSGDDGSTESGNEGGNKG